MQALLYILRMARGRSVVVSSGFGSDHSSGRSLYAGQVLVFFASFFVNSKSFLSASMVWV